MEDSLSAYWWIIILISLWSLPWKGWALWKAARANDLAWFILLLIVNTMGILEIFYIFVFSKRKDPKKVGSQPNQ